MWNVKRENARHVQNNVYHAIFNNCYNFWIDSNLTENIY